MAEINVALRLVHIPLPALIHDDAERNGPRPPPCRHAGLSHSGGCSAERLCRVCAQCASSSSAGTIPFHTASSRRPARPKARKTKRAPRIKPMGLWVCSMRDHARENCQTSPFFTGNGEAFLSAGGYQPVTEHHGIEGHRLNGTAHKSTAGWSMCG